MIILINFQISDREKNTLAWKSKTEQAKKGETLRELQKLNVQFVSLNVDINNVF